jgi:hypothetical protein
LRSAFGCTGTANGTPIQLWDCNGSGGRAWVIESHSHLHNPQSGRYLDVPGGQTADGSALQIYDGNTNAWRLWRLPPSGWPSRGTVKCPVPDQDG